MENVEYILDYEYPTERWGCKTTVEETRVFKSLDEAYYFFSIERNNKNKYKSFKKVTSETLDLQDHYIKAIQQQSYVVDYYDISMNREYFDTYEEMYLFIKNNNITCKIDKVRDPFGNDLTKVFVND